MAFSRAHIAILMLIAVMSLVGARAVASPSKYLVYHEWCAGLPSMKSYTFTADPLMAGVPEMPVPPRFFMNSLKSALIRSRFVQLTSGLKSVLNDPDFSRAVKNCFPDDPQTQLLFISSLVSEDVEGKLVAGMGVAAIGDGVTELLGLLGRAGIWTSRALTVGIIAQITNSLHEDFENYRRPLRRLNQTSMAKVKQGLATTSSDIEAIENLLKEEPNNPQLKILLAQNLAMQSRLQKEP